MSAVPESEQFLSLIAERIADEVADRVATKLQKPQAVERVLFKCLGGRSVPRTIQVRSPEHDL
jgi:hypothetical protein